MAKVKSLLKPILLIGLVAISCNDESNPVQENESLNTIDLIRNDMLLPHEGAPRGVLASFGWAEQPRVGWGNNPPVDWTAMLAWGQVYADNEGNPAVNTRFQIRNMQAWYLSKATNQWQKWTFTSNINGANYSEDFQNDTNVSADIRDESEGISATVLEGYNFHFWSDEGRVSINPEDIAGVWVSIEARLIVDNGSLPDDRSEARLLFSTGADYWESPEAEWDQWTTNGDIGIGRFRYLTNDWQAFNMHTLSDEQLVSNPPPFE